MYQFYFIVILNVTGYSLLTSGAFICSPFSSRVYVTPQSKPSTETLFIMPLNTGFFACVRVGESLYGNGSAFGEFHREHINAVAFDGKAEIALGIHRFGSVAELSLDGLCRTLLGVSPDVCAVNTLAVFLEPTAYSEKYFPVLGGYAAIGLGTDIE